MDKLETKYNVRPARKAHGLPAFPPIVVFQTDQISFYVYYIPTVYKFEVVYIKC